MSDQNMGSSEVVGSEVGGEAFSPRKWRRYSRPLPVVTGISSFSRSWTRCKGVGGKRDGRPFIFCVCKPDLAFPSCVFVCL